MIDSLLENICEKVGRQHGSFPNIKKYEETIGDV